MWYEILPFSCLISKHLNTLSLASIIYVYLYQILYKQASNKHSLVSSYLVINVYVCTVACLVLPSCHFLYFKTIRLICHLPLFYNIIYCISFDTHTHTHLSLCSISDIHISSWHNITQLVKWKQRRLYTQSN